MQSNSFGCQDYLYVELGLLVENLAIVALLPEVIDAVVDIVVVLVAVLRW